MGFHSTHRAALPWLGVAVLFTVISMTAGQNPHSPVCSPSYIRVTLTETVAVGTSVHDLAAECTDPDMDPLTFTIIGDNTNDQFAIPGGAGVEGLVQVANQELDAEAVLSYSIYQFATPWTLRIAVSDGANTSYVSLYIAVESINDNAPTMDGFRDFVNLPEDTAIGTVMTICTLNDADLPGSGHATPRVRITGGNDDGKFAIDPVTCALTLIGPLDFETTPSYSLMLEAYDNGSPPMTTVRTVVITVDDVNDHAPNCSFYNTIMEVDESHVTGDMLLSLVCQDLDTGIGGTLIYDRLSIVPTPAYLDVDNAGNIMLTQDLDYDNGPRKLEIVIAVAEGTGAGDKTTTVTVVFSVTDIDDQPPVFSQSLYTTSIPESTNVGQSVLQLAATDGDSPNTFLSQITFGWETVCSQDWFTVDPQTGSIFVKTLLDWETAPQVTCQVFAYSSDKSADRNIADVTINIEDVNDQPPMFTEVLFAADLTEEPPIGSSVLTVAATDPDNGLNGNFTFFLPKASPFTIDANTGKVSVLSRVDYEAETNYLVMVEARDKGIPSLTSSTYFSITVLPDNEFAPSLGDTTASISETSPPGTNVKTLAATDGDAGDDGALEYYLRDSNVPFVIERETGKLLVGVGLDADTQDQYSLTVEVRDKSQTIVKTSTAVVLVTVVNANDNSPVCSQLGPIKVTPATHNVGDILGTLSCTDGDGDSLTYRESGGDPNNIFTVDPNTGTIRLQTTPVSDAYIYEVSITDGTNTILVAVEINVETKLQWSHSDYVLLLIPEDEALTTLEYTFHAFGSYETITYDITFESIPGTFNLNPMSGELRLAAALDRELHPSHALQITARSNSGQTITADVDVFITDINDNPPEYRNSYSIINVSEDVATPTTIATIKATDPDQGNNAQITYSIISGNTGSKFQYDSSGNLKVVSALDYESVQSYTLVLQAKDKGTPEMSGTTVVYVIVANVDDNNPMIVDSGGTIALSLPEDTAIGAKVIHINVNGLDAGSDLVYEITSGNTNGMFYIDEKTGDIYLVSPLDRETLSSVSLTIQVTDTQGQTDTSQLEITITDVNDNDPEWGSGNYVFKGISYNPPAGTDIGTVTVTDQDLGVNQDITLTIVSIVPAGSFTFNGYTLQSLGGNTQDRYELTVQAKDAGTPSRSSTAYITVLIDPEFKQPLFFPKSDSLTVEETKVPGTLNYDSDATVAGAREHEDGDLMYSIISGNTDGAFYIETFTGTVQLIKHLSYATTPSYTLVIQAENRYNPALTDTFTLTITVTQVNKYPPIFTEDVYTYDVNENEAVGTSIGQVIANDQDTEQFGTVTYTLEPNSNFVIDPNTGVISVSSPLEYSTARTYNLYVKAVDDAGTNSMTGSSVVAINVIDFNNHPPTFAQSSYDVIVPETTAVGEAIYILGAVDLDSGVFGTVGYTIVSGNGNNLFVIDSVGTLTLNTALDYETSRQHVITVVANDGGTPSLSGTVTLTINVFDQNDNMPQFSPSSAVVSVSGAAAPLTPIYTAMASDLDSGMNGEINYIIQSGNADRLFNIDTVSGVIKTAGSLETASDFYTLEVIGVDQGIPTMTGTMTLEITVTPIDSTPPGDYLFSVSENEVRGTQVGIIPKDPSRTITGYTITGGNYGNAFAISMNGNGDGVLVTSTVLDRETYAFYQLRVTVQHSTGTDLIYVSITVTDDNDNPPMFDKSTLTLQMVENLAAGNVVGAFTVTDPDEAGPNSDVTISMAPGSPLGSEYFSIDTNGVITVAQPVSYEVFRSITFSVRAEDNGTPALTSEATVIVEVIDVNETITYTTIESAYYVTSEIPDDVQNGDAVYQVNLADVGITPLAGSTVRYITVDPTDSVFNIHSTTGVLTVNKEESILSDARYFQWVIVRVTSGGVTTSYALNIRLDTFNKVQHMIVITMAVDAATVKANEDTFLQSLQSFYTSPQRVAIWKVQDIPSTARRRLLATESEALVVVVQDESADLISNIDQPKTFLSSEAAAAPLQASPPDSTPQGSLTGGSTPATAVEPYEDDSEESMSTELIILIVVAVLAGIALLIGLIALIVYCTLYRRSPKDDKKRLVDSENRSNNFGRLDNSETGNGNGREPVNTSLSYGPAGENTVSGGGGPVNPGNMAANFLVPGTIIQTGGKPIQPKGKNNTSATPKKAAKQPAEKPKPPSNQSEVRSDPTLKGNSLDPASDPEADGTPTRPITATYVSSSLTSSKPSETANQKNDTVMLESLEEEEEA